jgi:uncharacterized protein with HEPN domain
MKRDYKLFVKDILDAIDNIEEFVGNMEYREFMEDDKTVDMIFDTKLLRELTPGAIAERVELLHYDNAYWCFRGLRRP